MTKRKPKSRSGRLLCSVRDNLRKEFNQNVMKGQLPEADGKLRSIMALSIRIERRLIREDQKRFTQYMMTDYSTVLEFTENGRVIRAKFAGDIDRAKVALYCERRARINWAHLTKGNELLIQGMWVEMDVY